jgi:hypothetical protein
MTGQVLHPNGGTIARSSHIYGRVSIVLSLSQEKLKYGFEEYEYKDADDVINKAGKGSRVLHVLIEELDRLSHHDKRFSDKFGVLGDLDKEREIILSQAIQGPAPWQTDESMNGWTF